MLLSVVALVDLHERAVKVAVEEKAESRVRKI
jgi:hypothetical protein